MNKMRLLYFTLLYFTLLYFTLLYFTLLYFTLLTYFTLLHDVNGVLKDKSGVVKIVDNSRDYTVVNGL